MQHIYPCLKAKHTRLEGDLNSAFKMSDDLAAQLAEKHSMLQALQRELNSIKSENAEQNGIHERTQQQMQKFAKVQGYIFFSLTGTRENIIGVGRKFEKKRKISLYSM